MSTTMLSQDKLKLQYEQCGLYCVFVLAVFNVKASQQFAYNKLAVIIITLWLMPTYWALDPPADTLTKAA